MPTFLIAAFLCILILTLSLSGKLKFISSFLEQGTAQIQGATFKAFNNLPFISPNEKVKLLEEKNLELLGKISATEKLKRENQALSDQFQVSYPKSNNLLKADIIGAPGFVPGISIPTVFILNKGEKDNVKKGFTVVLKSNLVGVVSQVSANLSKVTVVNNPAFSFTAKTESGAVGLISGGNTLTLDGILLSENLVKGSLIRTKGDVNSDGTGILPDLVVGKITSVEKNPSDLFQRAKVESFINFTDLTSVFIHMQIK